MVVRATLERLAPAAAPSFEDVLSAAARIRGRVLETPCLPSRTLSRIIGTPIHLKFENLQFTASFKGVRGA
jgi:threonine dehydratase